MKAESDGKFDFHFKYVPDPSKPKVEKSVAPYKIHPGTVKGLFNIQNIKTAIGDVLPFISSMDISSFYELSPAINKPIVYAGGASPVSVDLQPIYFDADVELESVVQGQVGGRVPAKKILGFVQIAPSGIPITPEAFQALLQRQLGSVGGPLDCIMDIGKSGQKFASIASMSTRRLMQMARHLLSSPRPVGMSCCRRMDRGAWCCTPAAPAK